MIRTKNVICLHAAIFFTITMVIILTDATTTRFAPTLFAIISIYKLKGCAFHFKKYYQKGKIAKRK